MDLYQLVLMLLEQQDEVITVTGIHVHPLTSRAQLTCARQIALYIYAEKGVCPCLHAVHTLMHVITPRCSRGTNVL